MTMTNSTFAEVTSVVELETPARTNLADGVGSLCAELRATSEEGHRAELIDQILRVVWPLVAPHGKWRLRARAAFSRLAGEDAQQIAGLAIVDHLQRQIRPGSRTASGLGILYRIARTAVHREGLSVDSAAGVAAETIGERAGRRQRTAYVVGSQLMQQWGREPNAKEIFAVMAASYSPYDRRGVPQPADAAEGSRQVNDDQTLGSALSRRAVADAAEYDPLEMLIDAEAVAEGRSAALARLARLTPEQRDLLICVYGVDGETGDGVAAAAKQLHVSHTTIRTRLAMIKQILAN